MLRNDKEINTKKCADYYYRLKRDHLRTKEYGTFKLQIKSGLRDHS